KDTMQSHDLATESWIRGTFVLVGGLNRKFAHRLFSRRGLRVIARSRAWRCSPSPLAGEGRGEGSTPTSRPAEGEPSQVPLGLAPPAQAPLSPPQGGRGSSCDRQAYPFASSVFAPTTWS